MDSWQDRWLFDAQRLKARTRLEAEGMPGELADRWLAAWAAASPTDPMTQDADFWERGARWASAAYAGGQAPPGAPG